MLQLDLIHCKLGLRPPPFSDQPLITCGFSKPRLILPLAHMYKQSLLADHPPYYELGPDDSDPPEGLPLQYDHLAKIRPK